MSRRWRVGVGSYGGRMVGVWWAYGGRDGGQMVGDMKQNVPEC